MNLYKKENKESSDEHQNVGEWSEKWGRYIVRE